MQRLWIKLSLLKHRPLIGLCGIGIDQPCATVQAHEVQAAYSSHIEWKEAQTVDGWVMLVGVRKA